VASRVLSTLFSAVVALALTSFAAPAHAGKSRPFFNDDFNVACGFPMRGWDRFVDPKGDSSLALTGTGTADAHLRITVPAGSQHDLWSDGFNSPRLMQPARNVDFTAEVKFQSSLTQRYQGQGIVVEASPGNLMRFDFFHDGTSVRIYSATFVNGIPTQRINQVVPASNPKWLRVARVGNTWSQSHSADGTNWTVAGSFAHTLAVTSIGVFALNDGNTPAQTPAHTAIVDSFANGAAFNPPEDTVVLGTGAPVNLTVNTLGSGHVNAAPPGASHPCGTQVSLTAVADPGFAFTGWTGDVVSAQNPLSFYQTAARTLTANFAIDTAPPVISNVVVTPGANAAIVTWTTNEPADSRVDFGLTAAYEIASEIDAAFVTAHGLALDGLAPNTTYHYRVTSRDVGLVSTSTGDLTFTTLEEGASGPSGVVSDDFSAANFDGGRWTFVNPKNDASLIAVGSGTPDARLHIRVPGGAEHEVGGSVYQAPRIMQTANDVDFSLEAKFESPLTQTFQIQGLLVEQSAARRMRFDFHRENGNLRVYAATYTNGSTSNKVNAVIPAIFPMWMRVERVGSQWTFRYSGDGAAWTTAGTFAHAITVSSVGVFAGNEAPAGGGGAPPHEAIVDYAFDLFAPVVPEDGSAPIDEDPPLLQLVKASAFETGAQISWITDEPATGVVRYGTTAAYELGEVDAVALGHDHSFLLDGLAADTTYHYQVESADSGDRTATSADFTFTTGPGAGDGPLIDVWYGDTQTFGGTRGLPQPYFNVLGNVSDPDGVDGITYTVNGGLERPLTVGPGLRRLGDPGDFNADVPVSDLSVGSNTITLRATDDLGNESNRNVTVVYETPIAPTLPLTIDWSTVADIQDVAQVIDGDWEIQGNSVRTLQFHYDRLVGIGDMSWTDYEATIPLTIHGINPDGFLFPSNRPALGVLLRWLGHFPEGSEQPFEGFDPLGGIGIYRISPGGPPDRLEIWTNDTPTLPGTSFTMTWEVPYFFKVRVETVPILGPLYSFKVWPQSDPEPPGWILTEQQTPSDLPNGSLVLLAHETDVSFGPVTITPLP
jgi:regulation of enolase protein 1 (concanavalin A-like superfamily)